MHNATFAARQIMPPLSRQPIISRSAGLKLSPRSLVNASGNVYEIFSDNQSEKKPTVTFLKSDIAGSRSFTPKVKHSQVSTPEEFPCQILFLSNSDSLITEVSSSPIYKYYSNYSKKAAVDSVQEDIKLQEDIKQIFDDASSRIYYILSDFFKRLKKDPSLISFESRELYQRRLSVDLQIQNSLKKEIDDRAKDLPESFLLLKPSGPAQIQTQKPSGPTQIQTHPYLSKRVGVHKLATLSSGIHADHLKVLGYIGFLNILFLHDDIKVDSLAPDVYTQANKDLLSQLHNGYMSLYDEVLSSFEKPASWSKETSQIYKELVSHSSTVDSKFGQSFFLGDAIVRFAQDVAYLLSLLSTPSNSGQHAKMHIRREVEKYFSACESEFENKIEKCRATFVKPTKKETIDSYLKIRRVNGAVAPCFEYVFLMHGLDIDTAQIPHIEEWQELRTLYIDHICIVNDLLSFPKELTETAPHNLVLILKEFHNDLKQGFSESKEYLDTLTKDILMKKKAYFENLKSLLIKDVVLNVQDATHQTLESLLVGISNGSVSIKSDQTSLDHIKNAYKSILLMEQWANGHIAWEHDMRSRRHDVIS